MKKVQDAKDLKEQSQAGGGEKRVIRARQRAIGRELRRFYDAVAEEPVPDDFLTLLRRIEGTGEEGEDDGTP